MQFRLAVMAGAVVLVFMPMLVFFWYVVRPWIRSLLFGIRVSLLMIVFMRIRRSDVNQIIDALVMALQSGVTISVEKMERASAQQVDLKKVYPILPLLHPQLQQLKPF